MEDCFDDLLVRVRWRHEAELARLRAEIRILKRQDAAAQSASLPVSCFTFAPANAGGEPSDEAGSSCDESSNDVRSGHSGADVKSPASKVMWPSAAYEDGPPPWELACPPLCDSEKNADGHADKDIAPGKRKTMFAVNRGGSPMEETGTPPKSPPPEMRRTEMNPVMQDARRSMARFVSVHAANWSPASAQEVFQTAKNSVRNSIVTDQELAAGGYSFTRVLVNKYMRLSHWVGTPGFEVLFACMIALDAVFVCVEAQCDGLAMGRTEGWDSYSTPCHDGASVLFKFVDWLCGLTFTLEVILVLSAGNKKFLCSLWGVSDLIIALAWWVTALGETILPLDVGVFRLARLTRLMRLLRIARTVQAMDAIFIMTTAIWGSFQTLAWTVMLMSVVQAFIALMLKSLLEEFYLKDPSVSDEDRQEVYIYFGTLTRAMFTMFEITFANWPTVSRILAEKVTEWFMVFAVCHKMVIGFAVVGVINGVFMQETFKAAATDDRIMVRSKQKQMDIHTRKMQVLFRHADTKSDGRVNLEQFKNVVNEPQVKLWLASMELDAGDADSLFTLLDDGDGHLTADELVKGVARLKGPARSIDLATLLFEQRRLQDLLSQVQDSGKAIAMVRTKHKKFTSFKGLLDMQELQEKFATESVAHDETDKGLLDIRKLRDTFANEPAARREADEELVPKEGRPAAFEPCQRFAGLVPAPSLTSKPAAAETAVPCQGLCSSTSSATLGSSVAV